MNITETKKQLNISPTQSVINENKYDLNMLGQDVCALLNSGGGFVLVEMFKQKSNDLRVMENSILKNIIPKALFSIEEKVISDKKYIIIEVPSGRDIPYSYNNSIFINKGNKADRADIETIKDMILSKQNEPIRWERRLTEAELNIDFDNSHFINVLENIVKGHRFQFNRTNDTVNYLEDFSLYKYGRLTNACDVLLCKNPSLRYPQTRAKATLFANDKTDSVYLDMKHFEGPLLIIFTELSKFISRNTPTTAYFSENDPRRQNRQLYPENAIREGLINALVHRDYSNSGGGVSVSIYPERLEIWNYGEFPKGVTPQSLDKGNVSVLRNPDIAHMLYLQGYMEKLGRGAKMIKKECTGSGLPEPQWNSEKGQGVTLTFFAPKKLSGTFGSPSGESILTDQERRIIDHLKNNKRFTVKTIEELLNVKESRARRIINGLIDRKLIEKKGKRKSHYYILLENL